MSREIVFTVLVLLVAGPLLATAGIWPVQRDVHPSARGLERSRWLRLWVPMTPGALAVGALLGWALAEPEEAEPVPAILFLAAVPFAAIWLRAAARAVRSLLCPRSEIPAASIGLLRPRVIISQRFERALDPATLRAVREHEEAHARHRDPLRIWLAQLAADLQWPWPTARERFRSWHRALELARDEEARARGVNGADLAGAIIAAARLNSQHPWPAGATISGDAAALRERIIRLLAPLPGPPESPRRRIRLVARLAGLAAAVVLGDAFGEPIVRALLLAAS